MKDCPFQTKEAKIKEARCIIPLILKPEELKKYCSMGYGSWFCKYYNKENECLLIKKIRKFERLGKMLF